MGMSQKVTKKPKFDHVGHLLNFGEAASEEGGASESKMDDFSKVTVGDKPFYPLSVFHAVAEQPSLPFPPNVLVSSNWFRPRWAGMGDRRLKNISLVMEWCPHSAAGERYLVALTLSEAETVRRMLHTDRYAVLDPEGGGYV